jgi:hypothetical protein
VQDIFHNNGYKPMTLKERIENNLTLYTLGLLLAGFVGGIGTFKFLTELNPSQARAATECKSEIWEPIARKDDWVPKNECPAFPMDMKLTSPGDNSVVKIDPTFDYRLPTTLVIALNRPLPEKSSLGIIAKPSNEPNFYVFFPKFYASQNRTTYRSLDSINLPFSLQRSIKLELRTFLIDDREKIGDRFNSIDQIKGSDSSVFIGAPIIIQLL